MEDDDTGVSSAARGSGEPNPMATMPEREPGIPATPAELFVSKKTSTLAMSAMFEQKGPPPKEETSDDGFHDPRDD
eukprot:6233567-Amphidinium_carterae.1